MREILFRGKRIEDGEWVYGSFCMDALEQYNGLCGVDGFIRLHDKEKGKMQTHEVDRETVGQYTGLTDKNGKRIFEGDVCQIKNHRLIGDLPFVIEWEDFAYNGWTWRDLDEVGAVDSFTNGAARHCDVIGNIHDNPELLKEG